MPDILEDDSEESIGTPSDDMESAFPVDDKKAVKFGWIRGVLVSCAGFLVFCQIQVAAVHGGPSGVTAGNDRDFQWLAENRKAVHSCIV